MSCERWQELVALDAGGDLPRTEVPALAAHLAGCASCAALAAELRALVGRLGELRAASADAEVTADVRAAVLRAVAGDRVRRRVVPTWWLAAAALLGAIGIGLWVGTRPGPTVHTPVAERRIQTATPAPAAAGPAPGRVTPELPPTLPARVAAAPPERCAAAVEPVLVKLVTTDPDVVFYLVPEQRSGA